MRTLAVLLCPAILLLRAQTEPKPQPCAAGLADDFKRITDGRGRVAYFQRQVNSHPGCFQAWFLLAKSHEELDQYGEAAKAYREAARVPGATENQIAFAQSWTEVAEYKAGLMGQASKNLMVTKEMIVYTLRARPYAATDPRAQIANRVNLHIRFGFDSDKMEAEGMKQASELYAALSDQALAGRRYEVIGHTDDVGEDQYNLGLSERRAKAVERYLVERGISASRLRTKGVGKDQPLFRTNTEAAHRANRRVEVRSLD